MFINTDSYRMLGLRFQALRMIRFTEIIPGKF